MPQKCIHFPSAKFCATIPEKSKEATKVQLLTNSEITVTKKKKGSATFKKLDQKTGCFSFSENFIILIFGCCDDAYDLALF